MRVGILVARNFHVVDLAPFSVFETANTILDERFYDFSLLSEKGGKTRMSFGVEIVTEPLGQSPFDTLVATSSREHAEVGVSAPSRNGPRTRVVPPTPGVIDFLKDSVGTTRRVASICVGAFALAEAGLLDGKRATTHWLFAGEMQARFPKIKVQAERIFVSDGAIWTSAGATAAIDLAVEAMKVVHPKHG